MRWRILQDGTGFYVERQHTFLGLSWWARPDMVRTYHTNAEDAEREIYAMAAADRERKAGPKLVKEFNLV